MELPESALGADTFREMCDHAFWHNSAPRENATFRHGDIVFCKIDEVWRLFRALRRTRKRIVLVTAEGDKPVTPELYAQRPPHVVHWFGTNMFAAHQDATPLPLGLGREGSPATLDWAEIEQAAKNAPPRENVLYANFGTASNPAVREPLKAWLAEPAQSWITRQAHTVSGKAEYLSNLLTHHFVLCPPGNGEDTHRMWEALYCGAIPVVRESPAMRNFKDLPVVFVPRLESISEEFLQAQSGKGAARNSSKKKLGAAFWYEEFTAAKCKAQQMGKVTLSEWISGWLPEIMRVIQRQMHLS